jgi:hypothetical protein
VPELITDISHSGKRDQSTKILEIWQFIPCNYNYWLDIHNKNKYTGKMSNFVREYSPFHKNWLSTELIFLSHNYTVIKLYIEIYGNNFHFYDLVSYKTNLNYNWQFCNASLITVCRVSLAEHDAAETNLFSSSLEKANVSF